MDLVKKLIIATTLVLSTLSLTHAQKTPIIKEKPNFPKDYWKNKEGFAYIKGNKTYYISDAKEYLIINEEDSSEIKIIEENHYGNVEKIIINNPKENFKLEMTKTSKGLKYHLENKKILSEEKIFKQYIKYDEKFRNFKFKNRLD